MEAESGVRDQEGQGGSLTGFGEGAQRTLSLALWGTWGQREMRDRQGAPWGPVGSKGDVWVQESASRERVASWSGRRGLPLQSPLGVTKLRLFQELRPARGRRG